MAPDRSEAGYHHRQNVQSGASTFWYHPALHMKTTEHILYSSGGFIIEKDPVEAALPLPRNYRIDDIAIVMTSRKFLAGGNQINTDTSVSPCGDYELTNGTMNSQVRCPRSSCGCGF